MREKAQDKFRKRITDSFLFKFFLLKKLPIALIAGVRLRSLDKEKCVVSVPFKWLTQNPFRSVYFATQAMAAEMSTGVLGLMAIQGCDPPLSMLVTNLEGEFLKKATSGIYFTCANGKEIFEAVEKAITTGEGVTVKAKSEGRIEDGTVVSNFYITWSFKQKTRK
ncbi:MAG: DUF4442 domain-containing protein [Fimbriimonadaceae bacterium]|nr:DUF4442 domain-containing protein [Chitinophagales bacterium]